MAQLVIRIRDRISGDFFKDARDFKRGDVMLVYADDQQHSPEILAHPDFRILIVPALSLAEAKALLSPQTVAVDEPAVTERTKQRRGFKFDIDDPRLPAALKAYLADDTRKQPTFTASAVTLTLARALKLEKARISDPAKIIGA